MIAIFDAIIGLLSGWPAGAQGVTLAKNWYVSQFAGAAEQILTVAGLVLYYYVLVSVNTIWQLVPEDFRLLVMGIDAFDPNEYED